MKVSIRPILFAALVPLAWAVACGGSSTTSPSTAPANLPASYGPNVPPGASTVISEPASGDGRTAVTATSSAGRALWHSWHW